MAPIACLSLAPKADEIDFGVPLPASFADRAKGIQAAIPRLKGHHVERVGAVGSIAENDVASMTHGSFLVLNPGERKT